MNILSSFLCMYWYTVIHTCVLVHVALLSTVIIMVFAHTHTHTHTHTHRQSLLASPTEMGPTKRRRTNHPALHPTDRGGHQIPPRSPHRAQGYKGGQRTDQYVYWSAENIGFWDIEEARRIAR